jgi:hypothetical protein
MNYKPVQFVNVHGQPVDIAMRQQEAYRSAYLLRSAGLPAKRKPTVKNGYAAPPGTGPAGEICKGCKHKLSMESNSGSKRFIKCELRRATWTHGEGTDIRAHSPACSKFEPKEPT